MESRQAGQLPRGSPSGGLVEAAAVQDPVADVPTFFAPIAEAINDHEDGVDGLRHLEGRRPEAVS